MIFYKKYNHRNKIADIELEIKSSEKGNETRALNALFGRHIGLEEIIQVKKRRVSINFRGSTIHLDEVENLGPYVTIESDGINGKSEAEVVDIFHDILKEIDAEYGEKRVKSYAWLLIEQKGNLPFRLIEDEGFAWMSIRYQL